MARDYGGEPPLGDEDRRVQRKRAERFRYRSRFALTIECHSEEDQQALFRVAQKAFKDRRIRVVVS